MDMPQDPWGHQPGADHAHAYDGTGHLRTQQVQAVHVGQQKVVSSAEQAGRAVLRVVLPLAVFVGVTAALVGLLILR